MSAVCLFALSGCVSEYANSYSEEDHLKRVAERVDERYMSSDYDFTSYDLYPVYDENEKLIYALVEFEPQGFVFVLITNSTYPWGHSMYLRDEYYLKTGWRCDYIHFCLSANIEIIIEDKFLH